MPPVTPNPHAAPTLPRPTDTAPFLPEAVSEVPSSGSTAMSTLGNMLRGGGVALRRVRADIKAGNVHQKVVLEKHQLGGGTVQGVRRTLHHPPSHQHDVKRLAVPQHGVYEAQQ